jgi:hypothetical protein
MIDKPVEGVKTDARPHPPGKKGARLSLDEVAERAWKARMSPRLRAWATQVLDKAGVSRGSRKQKMQALLDAFRAKVPYIADPVMGEFMATPNQLLCLDEGGLCIIGGDCFPEGTLLLRDDFEFVPIELIKVGERIWGYDKWSEVTQKWAKGVLPVDAIKMSNGSTMHLTADHKVYVDHRILYVSDLQEGDTLLQPSHIPVFIRKHDPDRIRSSTRDIPKRSGLGDTLRVLSIERAVRTVPCWDISTDDHYVYLPEHDVTVSNCDEATITMVALALCIGIPAMVVGSSHKPPHDTPTHVFGAFQDEFEEWIRMDGTTKLPIGKAPPRSREFWVKPGEKAEASGEGDFVGMSDHHGALAGAPMSMLDLLYPTIR